MLITLNFFKKNYNEEIISLINCITTNKTEFFREKYHFQFLNDIVFPQFEKEKLKKVRIWSAGCSTGEEPYTIAINLLEYFSGKCPFDVKILATDIDTNVLLKGKDGIYSQNPIEEIDANILKNYFYKGTGANSGLFKVKDSLKNLVSFRRLNLLNDIYPMKGKFHMIFCRNVVIYFDRESQKKLFDHFYKYLDDDGYLFVGHSEALTYLSDYFVSVGRSIYKKQ